MILHYIILHYIILYHIMLHYIILCYVILYYFMLYYIILYYIILYYIILYYIILYYITSYYIISYYIIPLPNQRCMPWTWYKHPMTQLNESSNDQTLNLRFRKISPASAMKLNESFKSLNVRGRSSTDKSSSLV